MAGKWDVFGRLDALEAEVRALRGVDLGHATKLTQHDAELGARADDVVRLDGEVDALSSLTRTVESEVDRLTERVAALEVPGDPPGPDLTDYLDLAEDLVVRHGLTWQQYATDRDDRVRYVIDGLTHLADAADARLYAELAIDLCARVGASYTGSTGYTWTADTRLAAGFRRAAEVARRLGVDGGPADAHADAVYRANEHRRAEILSWPVYQGQAGAMARLADAIDDSFADLLSERLFSEWNERGSYGAGFENDDRHPGGRPLWRSGRELAWLLFDAGPEHAFAVFSDIWSRCALDLNGDGRTFFASHIDGHVQERISATDVRPWHGAVRLADGLCLLPEARPFVRALLFGDRADVEALVDPGAVNFLYALNRSDPADGHYEIALAGGAALGETL